MNAQTILKYLNYKLTGFTEHDLHSPFLYNFYMELIKNKHPFGDFEELKTIRKSLEQNNSVLEITDLGAGSKKLNTNKRPIKHIAKYGIAPNKQAEFLYRLINKFKPNNIIELGTSIGLTTLYLSKAAQKSTIYTIEGCQNIFKFSKQLFKDQAIKNVNQDILCYISLNEAMFRNESCNLFGNLLKNNNPIFLVYFVNQPLFELYLNASSVIM